ncbi:MAG: M28 family peptidase [Cytophagales bacterium]|nr:MAG: M28 family peptidase [Cytophagales bacterium]TAF62562.1 MAG: M28 family peptidase [Cytophagales bacterium]
MRYIIFFASALILGLTAHVLHAQSSLNDYAKSITKADLERHVRKLAADDMEGRETGQKGQKMAAEYIMRELIGDEIIGPVKDRNTSYYQKVTMVKRKWKQISLSNGSTKLENLKDFFLMGDFEQGTFSRDLVFLGYGIDLPEYSDYKGQNVRGKFVVALSGEPKNKKGVYFINKKTETSEGSNPEKKAEWARKNGALGLCLLYEDDANFSFTLMAYKSELDKEKMELVGMGVSFSFIYASPTPMYKLMGSSSKAMKGIIKKLDAGVPQKKSLVAKNIKFAAEAQEEPVNTENVLGFVEGTDSKLKNEVVVISAHYDHIGLLPESSKQPDKINNGADDDASGVAAVLEIAEAMAQAKAKGEGPKRSILFAFFTGEEKGLLGSDYYSTFPIYPLQNTIANLNIDMIGRMDVRHTDPNYVYIIGSDMLSSELHTLSENTAQTYSPDIKLDYMYNDPNDPNQFYYRSDHYNFAKHDIPVIFYFTGVHEDYHKPGDEVEKIDFTKMEKLTKLIFHTATALSNAPTRPKVDKK